MKEEWDESYRGGRRGTTLMRGGRLNYRNGFKDVNKKVPAIFLALNTPLFNIDKINAAVRDLYEEIDQVVPLGWKFVEAVTMCTHITFPSHEMINQYGRPGTAVFSSPICPLSIHCIHRRICVRTVPSRRQRGRNLTPISWGGVEGDDRGVRKRGGG